MRAAYVDTSCLASIVFRERGASALRRRLVGFDDLFSSNLLEAELRAACLREGAESDPVILSAISWVIPQRPLSAEITRVLEGGTCAELAAGTWPPRSSWSGTPRRSPS